MIDACTTLPTKSLIARLGLNDWWPQSWPTTNSAQNMVPCASQYSGHTNLTRRRRASGGGGVNRRGARRFREQARASGPRAPRRPRRKRRRRARAHQLLAAYAAAAMPTTIATSAARCANDRAVFFSQQCAGMASRMSVSENGGAADRSYVPSAGGAGAGASGGACSRGWCIRRAAAGGVKYGMWRHPGPGAGAPGRVRGTGPGASPPGRARAKAATRARETARRPERVNAAAKRRVVRDNHTYVRPEGPGGARGPQRHHPHTGFEREALAVIPDRHRVHCRDPGPDRGPEQPGGRARGQHAPALLQERGAGGAEGLHGGLGLRIDEGV
jgi:hypothetical protein